MESTDLASMFQAQLQLQIDKMGGDPRLLKGDARKDFIRWNAYALEDELHEATNEAAWKPWADATHVHGEAMLKEMIDAWHFFMNILLVIAGELGLETRALADKFLSEYFKKNKVNADRQDQGYDGESGKCDHCRRDLATASVAEDNIIRVTPNKVFTFCNKICFDQHEGVYSNG